MQTEQDRFFRETANTQLARFHDFLAARLKDSVRQHGHADEWDRVLASINPETRKLAFPQAGTLQLGSPDEDHEAALRQFLPWRKGPLQIGSTFIDTEWRSDWKWQRIHPHLPDLEGKRLLDVGCGNGYYLFRMLEEGADLALGIDPTILFNYQFALMQRFCPKNPAYLLPLKSEDLPSFNLFDAVFSLGVLYHRHSPLDHLQEVFSFLRPGGLLFLETLTLTGDESTLLIPRDRYARMPNVWCIPSTALLEIMLQRIGFVHVRTLDVTVTSTEEQRATEWMQFQSLSDYLDPDDPTKTVEGHPAPTRALLQAQRPKT